MGMTASDVEALRKVLYAVDGYDSEFLDSLNEEELQLIFTRRFLFQTTNAETFEEFLKGNSKGIKNICDFKNAPKKWRDDFVNFKTQHQFSTWEDWRDYAMICYRELA